MTLADIGLLVTIFAAVAIIAIRYESIRKDSFRNKHDITGVGNITRETKDNQQQLQIMLFYLSLVACEGDIDKRQKVLEAMFEAATKD